VKWYLHLTASSTLIEREGWKFAK